MKKIFEPGTSFFTNCYEADWEFLLIEGRLEIMIQRCNYKFTFKALIINNVKNRQEVEVFAKKAVVADIVDAYYFSEDYASKVLSTFSIERRSFIQDFYDGYWYSMGPLTAIYLCKTLYLLYFTCDCVLNPSTSSIWMNEAILLFEENPNILVSNPLWDNKADEAAYESFKETGDWYFGNGFSDQCFFIRTATFYKDIYNSYHLSSERYPIYAGNLFEKRVYSYMRTHKFIRITNKHASYTHEKLIKLGRTTNNKSRVKKQLISFIGNLKKKIRNKTNKFFDQRNSN